MVTDEFWHTRLHFTILPLDGGGGVKIRNMAKRVGGGDYLKKTIILNISVLGGDYLR